MKRGEIAVWSASLIHGGSPIIDANRTRLSMTAHYFTTDQPSKDHWFPMLSVNGRIVPMAPENRQLFEGCKEKQIRAAARRDSREEKIKDKEETMSSMVLARRL